MRYHAIATLENNGLRFTIGELPEFESFSKTFDDSTAIRKATEDLAKYIEELRESGKPVASPVTIKKAWQRPISGDGYRVTLPVLAKGGETVRVNVSMEEHSLKVIDAAAKTRSMTRSAFLAHATRDLIMKESI